LAFLHDGGGSAVKIAGALALGNMRFARQALRRTRLDSAKVQEHI
jgi:hypothetical protein